MRVLQFQDKIHGEVSKASGQRVETGRRKRVEKGQKAMRMCRGSRESEEAHDRGLQESEAVDGMGLRESEGADGRGLRENEAADGRLRESEAANGRRIKGKRSSRWRDITHEGW